MACSAVGALTSVALLSAGGVGPAGATSTDKVGGTATWTGYFFPLKVGWTCHESLTGSGAKGSETETLSAVTRVPQGHAVTVTEGNSSTAGSGTAVPTNAALHFILTTGGQLVSVPSGIQVAGMAYSIKGNSTYPSVRTLLSGGSAVSRLQIAAPLTAADRAELRAVLPANATSLDMAVAVTQRGALTNTLTTAMGTFHHVLTVRSVFKSLAFTNVNEAASQELAQAVKPTIAKELGATTWYAPGVGPIKVTQGGFVETLTSCGLGGG
jgi:hypothetical protein